MQSTDLSDYVELLDSSPHDIPAKGGAAYDPATEDSGDSDNALEKYRLTSPLLDNKNNITVKSVKTEDFAFAVWVTDQKHESTVLSSGPLHDLGHVHTPKANFRNKEAERIINSPREYQLELFERAKEKNTIVVLDTGSGKTLIAALLIRHTLDQELERRSKGESAKAAFFLVDKVALCLQQYNVLCSNLEYSVGKFYGDTVNGLRTKQDWEVQVRHNMVIVCTAQILLDLLGCGLLGMNQISLLIFDEAHHAKKSHPYAKIMRDHYMRMRSDRPRVLGMTASPVDTKTGDFQAAAFELEETLCSIIATISDEALLEHMAQQRQEETFIYYGSLQSPEESRTDLWYAVSQVLECHGEFRTQLDATQDIASVLGPWCADMYWKLLLSPPGSRNRPLVKAGLMDLGNNEQLITNGIDAGDITVIMQQVRETVDAHFSKQSSSFIAFERDFSLKFNALREILLDAFESGQTTRCIVFVEKRYIACLLAYVFQQSRMTICNMIASYIVSSLNPQARITLILKFAKVGSNTMTSSIANMSVREQIHTLEQFRTGSINCLFATPVAEEGIDIPQCDLIVRFDIYNSAIQYIQSKGRARQVYSRYITMLEENNIHHVRRVRQAARDCNDLRRFCSILPSDRKVQDANQLKHNFELEMSPQRTYSIHETGAILTFYSSQQVLAKFVSSLPDSADSRAEYIVTRTYKGKKFIATVILPNSSPLQSFRGTPQSSKLLARGSVAFEACAELTRRNHINGHLQPVFSKRLPVMRNARLAISASKKSEYTMRLKPELWSQANSTPPIELFATALVIDGFGPNGRRGRPICILTRSRLPYVRPSAIHIGQGQQSSASLLQYSQPIRVTKTDVTAVARFTLTVFKNVFSKNYDADDETLPYFLAPILQHTSFAAGDLVRDVIDWTVLRAVCELEPHSVNTKKISQCPRDFQNRFISDPFDGSRKFITGKVSDKHRPFDPVPAGAPLPKSRGFLRVEKSIAEYSNSLSLKSRERRKWDPDQPVFEAEILPLRRNFLCEPKCGEFDEGRSCFIILEPLIVSSLPVDIVTTTLILPVIMYRIDSAAIAMDACRLLDLNIDPVLALEALTKDSSNTEQHGKEHVDFQQGMGSNYERLEFLGDAFLKMSTSISLFTLMPRNDEFENHVERMLLICNKNLFNHAVDRGLPEYVRSKAFDRRTWYPNLKLREGKASKTHVTQSLSDKSVADVCEALIGAAYLSEKDGRMDLAVKAVTRMVKSMNHSMVRYNDYYKKYHAPDWQRTLSSAVQQLAVDKIEGVTGYRFKSPQLLRSAFKHPSYPYEPEIPNYQRLEFLGDSLLDFAVVDYLFQQFPDADPQWLTEHKMAMVSNHFFACLCVELGLHRHLLTTNSSMTGKLTSFVTELKAAKLESQGEDDKPQANFWLGVFHPPKALSDMVEALVGAMFEDSGYNYGVVRDFFKRFILPYFEDMTLYDTYATGHPITVLTKLMQDEFCCRSWRLCVSNVPCSSETGMSALTENNVVCALMIHGRAVAHSVQANGRDAKIEVAKMALNQFGDSGRAAFQSKVGCEC